MNIKSSDFKRYLCILGLFAVAVSAIYFYYGSQPMLWELQTWDGNSGAEINYKAERLTQAHIGFFLLAVGSILQLVHLIKGKDIKWLVNYFSVKKKK